MFNSKTTAIIYATETDLSEVGGHVTHITQVVTALASQDCRVTLVVPRLGRYRGDRNLDIVYLPVINYRFLALLSFEVVLLCYLLKLRFSQKFDVLYVRSELYSCGATFYKLLFRTPLLVEVNSNKLDELARRNKSKRLLKLVDAIQRFNFRRADRIICTAKNLIDFIVKRYQIPETKIVYLHNAADIKKFAPQAKEKARQELDADISREHQVVGFSGSLVEWQGLSYLVQAAKIVVRRHENAIFMVVGDGPLRNQIESEVASLGLSKSFRFVGRVPHNAVPMYINACDLCVIPRGPGIVGEPVKLYEYMSCGKPVVAPNLEGYEFVAAEACGVVFEAGNAASLARAINMLLDTPEKRNILGSSGRRLAEEKYNWDHVAGRIHNTIRELIR